VTPFHRLNFVLLYLIVNIITRHPYIACMSYIYMLLGLSHESVKLHQTIVNIKMPS
jgi:hypothetical protein